MLKRVKKVIIVNGMHCEHCQKRVEDALSNLREIKSVEVNLENKKVIIVLKKEIEDEKIRQTIENLGYSVESIDLL